MRNPKHLLPASVALVFLLLALDYGGFPADATAGVAIGAWWILLVGLLFGLLPQGQIGRIGVVAVLFLTGLAVLTAVSIGWASDQGEAFSKTVQLAGLLGLFALILMTSREGSAREWAGGIVTGLFLVVLLAALGRFFPGLGDDTQLTRDLAGTQGRLSWPLGYWNAMGGLTAMATVGLLWFSANGLSRLTRSVALSAIPIALLVLFLTSSRGGFLALAVGAILAVALGPERRLLGGGLAVAAIGGGLLSYIATNMDALLQAEAVPQAETDGLLLFGATLLVTLAIGLARYGLDSRIQAIRPFKPRAWKHAVGVSAVLAVLFALNPIQRVEDFSALPEATTAEGTTGTTDHLVSTGGSGRAQIWEPAIEAFREEPLIGIGAGGFETYYLSNRDVGWVAKHSHSLPLQIAAELGVAGLLLLFLFVLTAVVAGARKWSTGRAAAGVRLASISGTAEDRSWLLVSPLAGIAAAGAVSMSLDWSAEFPIVAGGVLACLALVIGPATDPPSSLARTTGQGPWERLTVAVLIPIGLVSLWAGLTSLRVETKLSESREAVTAGNLDRAGDDARSAIEILPMAAAPRVQLALVEELQENHRAALVSIDQAIERDPEKSSNYLLRARILLRLGREDQARESFEKARTLNPRDPIFVSPPPA